MTKVLIVEDEPLARRMLESFVDNAKNYRTVASIDNAAFADTYCEGNAVDLILMDVLTAGNSSGLDAAARIKYKFPQIKIIIVTNLPEYSFINRARAVGVDCFWYKTTDMSSFVQLMNRCMAGESIYPDAVPVLPLGNVTTTALTPKEIEVLRELLSGDPDSRIAERMGVTVYAVRWHVNNMLRKTGYRSRLELAIRAREMGIVVRA